MFWRWGLLRLKPCQIKAPERMSDVTTCARCPWHREVDVEGYTKHVNICIYYVWVNKNVIRTCICIYMCLNLKQIHKYVCIYILYIYIYISMYTCMHMYIIYIYIYTHATPPPKPISKPLLTLFRQVLYPTAVQTKINDSEYCLLYENTVSYNEK